MKNYKSGAHTRYDLKVYLVWITKYRKRVLHGAVAERLRELLRRYCQELEVEIIKGHVSKDHIHLLLGYPPKLSVSKMAQSLKGKSSHKLMNEYRELRKQFWGQRLWARGYFVASSGNVTDEMIMEYIENQDKEKSDDNFRIHGEK